MENFNRHAPCEDKNCSFCCNPVKIHQRRIINGLELPKDKEGKELWIKRDEIFVPEDSHDYKHDRYLTFDCINFDKETGKCLDYGNRPDVCKNTTCINSEKGDLDKQHKEFSEINFMKIK